MIAEGIEASLAELLAAARGQPWPESAAGQAGARRKPPAPSNGGPAPILPRRTAARQAGAGGRHASEARSRVSAGRASDRKG